MIKTNTLFILGAGASKPFGYPTGKELRDLIRGQRNDNIIVRALAGAYPGDSMVVEFR